MKNTIQTEPDSLGLVYSIDGDNIDIVDRVKPWRDTIPPLEQRCEKAAEIINACPLRQPLKPGYYPQPFFNAKIDRDICIVKITMPGWPEDLNFYIAPSEAIEEQIDGSELKTPAWTLYIDDDKICSTMTIATALGYLYEWDKTQSIQGELRTIWDNTPNI